MLRTLSALSATALLLVSALAIVPSSSYLSIGNNFKAYAQQTPEKGPYIDEARFIHYPDEAIALQAVRSGDIDAYYFRMPNELAQDARDDPKLKVYNKIAGTAGILVNPAPANSSDSINPFSYREVRFALNYLVDRNFIVNEVMKGDAAAMVDPFGVYSPDYPKVIDTVESFGFRYNPNLANSMIEDALDGAGAVKQDDKWMYKGKPITVKMLIRSDDPARKSIGEIISSSLEGAGFTVEKEFGDLLKANTIVYGSNPQDFQWNLYTEGFAGTSTFVKDNPLTVGQMYGPWFGSLPGGQNPAFWNYENKTLDDITQKIFFFNFTSEKEHDDLLRQATEMGIQESVRIFLVQNIDAFVTSSAVDGWVNDFGSGITSKYSLINAVPANGGKSVDIGVKQIYQGAWNGVGGYGDAYSRDIYSLIVDGATFRHPFTGEIIPVRDQWTDIATNGPSGTLDVAPDAQVWDPQSQQWKSVGDNQTAKSKVTYKLLYSNWHDGMPMSKADILYSQYFTFEWGTNLGDGDSTVDSEFTSQVSGVIPLLKGIRFTSDDTVESYIDIWHYDEKEIADSGAVWAGEPWEITAATERLVTEGKFAYSRTDATAKNVDWLSLILPPHAAAVKSELEQMKNEKYIPPALKGIVSVDEAIKRYDASIKWITDHNNAVIGNGPFYLDNYNIEGKTITVKAFRDPSYPFEQGHWASYKNPELAKITKVSAPTSFTIGQPSLIEAFVTVADKPSNEAVVDYFVSNGQGKVVARGEAKPSDTEGRFEINLGQNDTSLLTPGPDTIKIFANSKTALRPYISTQTIIATTEAPAAGQQQTGAGAQQNNNNNASVTPPSADNNNNNSNNSPINPQSGCLIATAAYGSELTPQVQYLRNFRQNYILSTASGSAFMNTFNTVYYSFSPGVADYERTQPWLQQTVRAGLYPLFGILNLSEKSHAAVGGGEIGSVVAGLTAAGLIGAVYLSPVALLATRSRVRLGGIVVKLLLAEIAAVASVILIGIYAGGQATLPITTAAFVLLVASASALAVASAIWHIARKLAGSKNRRATVSPSGR